MEAGRQSAGVTSSRQYCKGAGEVTLSSSAGWKDEKARDEPLGEETGCLWVGSKEKPKFSPWATDLNHLSVRQN